MPGIPTACAPTGRAAAHEHRAMQPFSSSSHGFGAFFTAYSVSDSKRTGKNFWGTFVQGCRSWKESTAFLESWGGSKLSQWMGFKTSPLLLVFPSRLVLGSPLKQGLVVFDSQSDVPNAVLDSAGSFSWLWHLKKRSYNICPSASAWHVQIRPSLLKLRIEWYSVKSSLSRKKFQASLKRLGCTIAVLTTLNMSLNLSHISHLAVVPKQFEAGLSCTQCLTDQNNFQLNLTKHELLHKNSEFVYYLV